MATELTTIAQIKAQSQIQEPQLVLKIDGVDTVFGIGKVKKYVRIGDENLQVGPTWKIGGLIDYEDQLDVIDLEGTSNQISQQLQQERGGTSSISSIQVSLVDLNGDMTKLITPSEVVDDILGRKASVYLGYQNTAWPQDFVRIFSGLIDEVQGGTTIIINVAHPEQKKRAQLFTKITTDLTQPAFFRAVSIQKILYQTRRDVVGTVTVTYIGGATVGNEIVTVAGTNIVVQIDTNGTQARHIRDAIERSIDAVSLVDIKIESGFSNEPQTIQAMTELLSDTTIHVTTTRGMLLPVPSEGFRTYVRINDEVIEYTGKTDTTLTGCVRGALSDRDRRAEGASHEAEDSVETFYRIEGQAFDLALKLMFSGGPEYYVEGIQIKSIVQVEGVGSIPNAVWFDNLNIQDAWGVTIGDKVTITGDTIPTNNVTDAIVSEVVSTPFGSYLVLDAVSLTPQAISTGFISFKSKWNVWPEGAGLGLGGDEVDAPEFERIKETFSSSLFSYDFYLKDTITAKDFIDTEILFPTGAYTLPRRGKISVGYTSPPIGTADVKVLDSTNTTKPQQTRIKRSINRYFYNNVLFKFNEAVVDDLFLSGDLDVNQESKNRIPVGNKTLVIEARGLRPSGDAQANIEILKRRFQDKYKFGAEQVSVFAFYGKTFNTDVGDVVVFGDSVLNLPDTKNGSREFAPRLFEVANKSLSIKTGEVRLDLVDTSYSLANGRYGIVSPASLTVASGPTAQIKIKNSFETRDIELERTKWLPFVGQRVIVHNDNWDFIHETELLGFAPADPYIMLLKEPAPFSIGENYVVDIAQYPDNDNPQDQQLSKRVFVFTNPTVEILSGVNQNEFTVAGIDVAKFFVGATIMVRDQDWSNVSVEVKVNEIAGSTIKTDEPLGFVPLAGFEVDLIGFKDKGAPYRYL
jgi:hypothetical protein